MNQGRTNRSGDGAGLEPRVAHRSLGGSTPPPSVRPWTEEQLRDVIPVASSRTNILKRLGVKKTQYRLRALSDDIARLGVTEEKFADLAFKRVSDERLAEAVVTSITYSDVLRFLGVRLAGGSINHYKKRIEKLGLDTSHFLRRGWSKNRTFGNRWKKPEETLIRKPAGSYKTYAAILRRAMLMSGFAYRCQSCGLAGEWMSKKIILQVDHIDGDPLNNLKENLRFLCPNCHSQTDNYKVRNVVKR